MGKLDLILPDFQFPGREFWLKIIPKCQIPYINAKLPSLGLISDRCITGGGSYISTPPPYTSEGLNKEMQKRQTNKQNEDSFKCFYVKRTKGLISEETVVLLQSLRVDFGFINWVDKGKLNLAIV